MIFFIDLMRISRWEFHIWLKICYGWKKGKASTARGGGCGAVGPDLHNALYGGMELSKCNNFDFGNSFDPPLPYPHLYIM